MRPNFIGTALMLLLSSFLCNAQNDTPMEVLINIANENERYINYNLFQEDERSADYLDKYLSNYALLKIDKIVLRNMLEMQSDFVKIVIPRPGSGSFNLKMVNYDIRSDDFSIIERSSAGDFEIENPKAVFYRGILDRGSDTQAGVSIFENEVYSLFSSIEEGNIILAKDPIQPGENEENYIVYFESDLKGDREMNCLSDKFNAFEEHELTSGERSNVYDTCEDIEIEIEATHELYKKKNSNTFVTSNFISAFFNNVSIIYRNERIYTSIKRIIVNTSADDYNALTTSQAKLFKYAENTKNTHTSNNAELAHLVDYNEPGLGGIAWINVLCTPYTNLGNGQHYGSYAYSSIKDTYNEFPDYSLTVFMFSHEMGHNLGSRHTQSCSWPGGPIDNCAPVENGSCDPGPAPTYGGTIMSYCHVEGQPGINLSLGFGVLPGNKIRTLTQEKTCTEKYVPYGILASNPNLTLIANRECTDAAGWTHYYYDNNSASETDDKLLLSVKKGSEDIGNLNDGSLTVKVLTSSKAGSGSTHIDNPGYDASDDWHVMNRWFELIPTKEPGNPVTVRFPYTSRDFQDVMDNQEDVAIHQDLTFYKISLPGDPDPDQGHSNVENKDITFYTNSNAASLTEWKYISGGGDKHIAEFKVSSFSGGGGGFSTNAGLILPVELLEFTAEKHGAMALLSWSTASEINNDRFIVERSRNGIDFIEIGRIKGRVESSAKADYEFLDRRPESGINYYRLKQIDLNGDYEYLGIKSLDFQSHSDFTIFPNPLHSSNLNLQYLALREGDVVIHINSLDGKRIFKTIRNVKKGENLFELELSTLTSGIYLVQIIEGDMAYYQKLIKD